MPAVFSGPGRALSPLSNDLQCSENFEENANASERGNESRANGPVDLHPVSEGLPIHVFQLCSSGGDHLFGSAKEIARLWFRHP